MPRWRMNSLGAWEETEEYRSPNAGTVYKAPQPELTDEEKKQKIDMEKERYLKDPDQEDLSQQVNYSEEIDVESLTNLQKQRRDAQENKEFDRLIEEARGLTGRAKAAKLKQAKRVREGNTGMTISEVPGAAWNAASQYASGMVQDPAAVSEYFTEMYADYRALQTGAKLGSVGGPLGSIAGGAGMVWARRAGAELLDEWFSPRFSKFALAMDAKSGSLDNVMMSKGSGGAKSIKQITLEDRLNDPRIEKFLTGKGKLQNKELSNLVQEFADREDFMGVVSSRIDQLKEKYPHLIRKLDDQKETIALRWHHVNPSKGPIDLYKGLTDPADRAVLRDTLVNEFEVFSGNHPLNNRGLSIDVHDQIHDWLGENIGLRADVLKHKWAKTAGVDVGDLAPGKGFMKNHKVLTEQGRDAFDAWFSKLKPDERLPYIREYGGIIKESEGILGDLMQQYDALFAVPEGFRLTPDNEVLLRFLDELSTDGSRPLQQNIKAIVEQVNREMPRGTVNIVNEEGVVKQLNLESDIYKRIIKVKAKLDATKDLRKARSLKNELKDLEAGILQKTLDFSGAQKQGAWKKRLEQEKLRRQGNGRN